MPTSEINSPLDLKKLQLSELEHYAEDLRQQILTTSLMNGGHLGASLGTVELAIALHFVFESPKDSLVWDVGHQAYAHKLITGRANRFSTLRKKMGISGFLSRDESEHDVFGAGHSSTSVSAALAMAWANGHIKGEAPWSIAVIGDGAITAGLSFEALNNVRAKPIGPFVVVLNDNQMSISPNVGAVTSILSGENAKEFFSLFGFDYMGPVDGHDLSSLIGVFQKMKNERSSNPMVLHVLTQKGKGYAPAEEHPENFHGVSPLKAKVADLPSASKQRSFSEAFGSALCELAEKDPRIVAITAAMPEGTGLVEFSRRFPERFFDVGIAEPHAVTFAAGLATKGFKPVVAIYSTFLQRALDQIIHDVALQNLDVIFAIDRAGLVGADGPTHHGAFDIPYLGMIPNMKLHSPAALSDVKTLLQNALTEKGPSAIRYPRGSGTESFQEKSIDGVRELRKTEAPKSIVVAVGPAISRALKVRTENVAIFSLTQIKPLPQRLVDYLNLNLSADLIILEDGAIHGGFGETLVAELSPRKKKPHFLGYGDHFIPHGTPAELEEEEQVSSIALEKLL
jgi:1-deoxy-D-xylulose-5-phosphate synthase